MGLETIQGVGPATVKKLNKAGVRTLDDARKMDIATIAKKTGLAPDRLTAWQTAAKKVRVIGDVPGIGPATLKKLKAAGVADLTRFAATDANALSKKTGVAAARIVAWQAEAKKLTTNGAKAVTKAPARAAPAKKTKAPAKATRPTVAAEPAFAAPAAFDDAPIVTSPPLILAGADGTQEYRNGTNGIDQSGGFFRKVMTFLTGGAPSR